MDNEIEACEKVAENARFITVKVGKKNHFLIIRIENVSTEDSVGTVNKYDGECHYDVVS